VQDEQGMRWEINVASDPHELNDWDSEKVMMGVNGDLQGTCWQKKDFKIENEIGIGDVNELLLALQSG
jgi:hypothetical protein